MRTIVKHLSIVLLLMLSMHTASWAQTKTITGSVKNNKGDAVPYATIQQKGTNTYATALENGNFTITVNGANPVLIISSSGYATIEQAIGTDANYDIILSDKGELDEVMVVAYGTSTKKSFTGAASVLKQEAIKDFPNTSFENALNGKVAGLQVTQSSGQAGAAPSIRIRGFGSMNASNEPLYVIDGVPVVSGSAGQLGGAIYTSNNIMNTLNPADIETITVLKDAAASSLYGSRAANGVVIIQTKKGKTGKPRVSFKTSFSMSPSWATDNYEKASEQDNVNMLYQVFHDYNTSAGKTDEVASNDALRRLRLKFNMHGYDFNTAGFGRYENVNIVGLTDGLINRDGMFFDWDEYLFRTGRYNTNDLSVSGGTNGTNYYTSISYTKDESRVIDNEFDRISGRVNLTQKIGSNIELMTNLNIASTNQKGFNDTRNTGLNMFYQERNLLWGMYWPVNYKTGAPWTARYGSLAQNQAYYRDHTDNGSKTLALNALGGLTVNITKDLKAKTVFSFADSRIREFLYYSGTHFNGTSNNGSINEYLTNIRKMVSSTTVNYVKNFNEHGLDLLVGFEAEKNQSDFMRSTGTDLPSYVVRTVATAGVTNSNAYGWGDNMQSLFSRAEYNYDQRYYLSLSLRQDGSSRLAPESRWGSFWSIGGAWRLDQESFLKEVAAISNLRLRASYGVNGTLPSSSYAWRDLYGYSNAYMGVAGGLITTAGNPFLKWEKNHTMDVALEFGLLNQRITGSIEYFDRKSKDLILSVSPSLVTGFGGYLSNVGQITNKGVELELAGDIIQKQDFRWGLGVNATFLKSNVDKLYRSEGANAGNDIIWSDPTGGDARASYIFREGNPYLSFYGLEWAGVDPTNGKNVWYVNDPTDDKAGAFLHNGRGASYRYQDANRKILGNATPDVYGGISTDVEYKNFSLALNFIYKLGGKLYDGALKDIADDGYYWERPRGEYTVKNMWTDNNKSGSLPKLDGNDLVDPQQMSTRNMFDASMLRLKNITLAYKLPNSLLGKTGLSSVRVFANGTNLLTTSNYKIADPEVNQYGTRGWELPFSKTFTFGLEVNF